MSENERAAADLCGRVVIDANRLAVIGVGLHLVSRNRVKVAKAVKFMRDYMAKENKLRGLEGLNLIREVAGLPTLADFNPVAHVAPLEVFQMCIEALSIIAGQVKEIQDEEFQETDRKGIQENDTGRSSQTGFEGKESEVRPDPGNVSSDRESL